MHSPKSLNKHLIYLLVFLFTLHLTPAIYIHSSFLEQFINKDYVGYIFSIASVFTLVSFLVTRKFLKKYGNYKTTLYLMIISFFTSIALALATNIYIAVPFYILNFLATSLIFFNLDIFLESSTKDSETGDVRGHYMTFLNLAFLLGPFITSFVLIDHDFWKVFTLGAIIQIPLIYILIKYLKNFKDPIYQKPKLWKNFLKLRNNSDLLSTFSCAFLLRFFFSWMIVYTPIYLINEIGFTVSQTTFIIGLALIPFVLLEIGLGKISDKYIGEKEIMTAGFLIMGISTILITFIDSANIVIWATILFITRIGATMVEIMSEIHLFKRVDAKNINIIGIFRSVRPVAYVISPIVASLLLIYIDFKFLFLILGIIMLYGMRFSLSIKDTK